MAEAITKNVKYIFLDIEKYSRVRSVEAQVEIIKILNDIVKNSVTEVIGDESDLIYLPTGDGICISLLDPFLPYDSHLKLSLKILEKIDIHNKNINDEMRIFSVRIGLNENVDNLVQDINGKLNVTGAGINMAQRIMGLADGNQILVSQSIFETFKYREKYMNKFRPFQATVKHDVKINVYQFISDEYPGLNCDIPREFVLQEQKAARLTAFAAYYFAHSIRNKEILLRLNHISQDHHIAIVLLYFLAKDSEGIAKSNDVNPYSLKIFGGDRKTIEEQYNYYGSINYWVISEFASLVEQLLIKYKNCFEKTDGLIFINKKGIEKLKKEFPDIYESFDIENVLTAYTNVSEEEK